MPRPGLDGAAPRRIPCDMTQTPNYVRGAIAPLRWQSWPLRDDPIRALLVTAGLGAVGLLVRWITGEWHLAALAAAAMAAGGWRFFVPVVFELSGEGVDQWVFGRRRHIPWTAVRCHEAGPDGVLLLPTRERSPLAFLRGLHVPFGAHRDEVLAIVRHYLGPPNDADAPG